MYETHQDPSKLSGNSLGTSEIPSKMPPIYADSQEKVEAARRTQDLQHYLLVLNSKSGNSRCEELKSLAQAKAQEAGKKIDFVDVDSEIPLSTAIDAAIAEGVQILVAAGGDGTVAAVATEAKRVGLPLALIPSGTANLLARELGIPLSIEEAVKLLFQSWSLRSIDVVTIKDKAYLCHISVGAYSWIASNTQPPAKKRFGRLAYVWNGLRLVAKKKHWTFRLCIDGKLHVRRASTLMITNVGAMGAGNLRWSIDASPDDGQIEIVVIRARTLTHYFRLFVSYVTGQEHPHLQETLCVRSAAKITSSAQLWVMGDGEEITQGDFEFKVEPQALAVLVPAANSSELH